MFWFGGASEVSLQIVPINIHKERVFSYFAMPTSQE